MPLLAAILVALALTYLPVTAEAVHEEKPLYTLFVEEPAGKMSKQFDEELSKLSLSEINEYLDRQEVEGRAWNFVPSPLLRPLQLGVNTSLSNMGMVAVEEFEIVEKLWRLYESYGYPRLDIRVDSPDVKLSLRKPTYFLEGIRLGLSLDIENPTYIGDLITPVPYLKVELGRFVSLGPLGEIELRARYNWQRNVTRVSLRNRAKSPDDITLSAVYEHDFNNDNNILEFFALKRIGILWDKYDLFGKILARLEEVSSEDKRRWCKEDCFEIVFFAFFSF